MAVTGPGDGRPAIYPALRYREARAAIAFLKEAFGFTELRGVRG